MSNLLALAVLFFGKATQAVIQCTDVDCVIDGARDLIIANKRVNSITINCMNKNCAADSSTMTRLELYSSASKTIVNCLDKDDCIGAFINCGGTPPGFNKTYFDTPKRRTCSIELNGEASGKEMNIEASGKVKVVVSAKEKSSFESGSILCGVDSDSSTQCIFSCANDKDSPCKQSTCEPLSNCACSSLGTNPTTCPTPEPTNEPTKKPTTGTPTKSPTTPKPTTAQPTGNPLPEPTEPVPPACINPCEGQTTRDCVFEGSALKTYVCTNEYDTCVVECGSDSQCAEMVLISGATNTLINCTAKDSCKNGVIEVGSDIDDIETRCNNLFLPNQFSGVKNDVLLRCGTNTFIDDLIDESACKDLTFIASGSITGEVRGMVNARTGFSPGTFICDIDDNAGECLLRCNKDFDACKDVNYECLATSSQCDSNCTIREEDVTTCPIITNFGDSSCAKNDRNCIIEGKPGGRIVVPKDVVKVTINCVDCRQIEIYSAAQQTTINSNALDAMLEATILLGDIGTTDKTPKGFLANEFITNVNKIIDINFNEKTSGKTTRIETFGKVQLSLNARAQQAFEEGLLICNGKEARCQKSCLTYVESCARSTFVCPNVEDQMNPSICRCRDIRNRDFNSTEIPESSCTTPIIALPVVGQSGIMSQIKKVGMSSNAKLAIGGIIAAILVFGGLIILCNYKERILSKKYYKINSPAQKFVEKPKVDGHFQLEMEATTTTR